MTISPQDAARIALVIENAGAGQIVPDSLKRTGSGIRFELTCTADEAMKACHALLDAGLQHDTSDDKPEFRFDEHTDEGNGIKVLWNFPDMGAGVFAGDVAKQS